MFIYCLSFSKVIFFPPLLRPVQPSSVGPVDVRQGRLPKCNDPRERSPRSFYLLGLFICSGEMSGLVRACVHLIGFSSCLISLERITLRRNAAPSSYPPSPNKPWRWSVLSDRQELTAQSKQWRYAKDTAFWSLQREITVNLYSLLFSVSLLPRTQCWSKWLSWQGSGSLQKG